MLWVVCVSLLNVFCFVGCQSRFTHANRHCSEHPYAALKRCNEESTQSKQETQEKYVEKCHMVLHSCNILVNLEYHILLSSVTLEITHFIVLLSFLYGLKDMNVSIFHKDC